MSACPECGLPIPACNALAKYRIALGHLKRGRLEEAKDMAESALAEHEEWEQRRR